MLRGGALKPTLLDGMWAHIVCAVAIAEVSFEDVSKRGPINVQKVPVARTKLVSIIDRKSDNEIISERARVLFLTF